MRRYSHRRNDPNYVPGPRSWRTRSDVAMRATGWTRVEVQGRILRSLYSMVGPTPKWARLAYDRGWITLAAFLLIPNEPGPTFKDLIYAESPLFRLFKQKTAPVLSASETA